jgi:hypothetical protein
MRLKGILSGLFILGIMTNSQMVLAGFVEKNIEKTQIVKLNQSATDKGNSAWWRGEKARRQKAIDDYLKKNKKGWTWFDYHPVAISGIPAIMQRVLPDVFPEIWGSKSGYMEKTGLFASSREKHVFPEGYSWGRGSKQLTSMPLLNKLRMMISNFTCTACHVGRVIDDQGKTHKLIGAPNTRMDVNAYRSLVTQTKDDDLSPTGKKGTYWNPAHGGSGKDRWKYENFMAAISKKKSGWLYNIKKYTLQEKLDTAVFKKKGKDILKAIKANLDFQVDNYKKYLPGVYGKSSHLLWGGAPGMLEPFAVAAAKLIAGGLPESKAFGPGPALSDIMSVWNQNSKTRPYGQWDGNIKTDFFRNLLVEIGVTGDPKTINYENAVITTEFVKHLPSPPYIFDVNKKLADQGKEIYMKSCNHCHGSYRLVPLKIIGTDPGRAKGLTPATRKALIGATRVACRLGNKYDCDIPDSEIIPDRSKNPVYASQPLDGIWARAPFLHNGSVPTLYHLLVPSERPRTFRRGNLHYDKNNVGFEWRKGGMTTYNTKLPGLSNVGHSDRKVFFGGIDFKKDAAKRKALMEYLKTL